MDWTELIKTGLVPLLSLAGILIPYFYTIKREDKKEQDQKKDQVSKRFDSIESILSENFNWCKKSLEDLEKDATKSEIARLRDEFYIWYNLLNNKDINRADYEKIEDIYRKYKNLRYPDTGEIPNGTVDRMMDELKEQYKNQIVK